MLKAEIGNTEEVTTLPTDVTVAAVRRSVQDHESAAARHGWVRDVATAHPEWVREAARDPDRAAARQRIHELTTRVLDQTGKGLVLTDADLCSLDLSGFDLRGANFNRAQLYGTDLSGANLAFASMVCAGMERTKLDRVNMHGAYVHAMAAQVCSFREADLTALVDATGALFHGCVMPRARLDGGMLNGTTFYQCDLEDTSFAGANLQGSTINECLVSRADFSATLVSQLTITKCHMDAATFARASGTAFVLQRLTASDGLCLAAAELPGLRLDGVRMRELDASGVKAPNADVVNCSLEAADFRDATLGGSRWHGCHLAGVDLSRAKLEQAVFVGCMMNQAILESALCENMHVVECQLRRARMAGIGGRCLTVRDTPLDGADLHHAYLYRAMLTGDPPRTLCLKGADLSAANLVQAYVAGDLRGVKLRNANLTYGRFNQTDLRDADLSGCAMFQCSLVKVNFTGARLDGVRPPMFVDRCPGLKEALQEAGADGDELAAFVVNLERVMQSAKAGST